MRRTMLLTLALAAGPILYGQQYGPPPGQPYGQSPDPSYSQPYGQPGPDSRSGQSPDPSYSQPYGQRGPDSRSGYGYYAKDPATRIGFMDGMRHGQRDLYTGHSYRPTHDGDFRHADRGYDHHFGPKWEYKNSYREAYLRGYQQGYAPGNRGYRRAYPDYYNRGYRY
jgi:hypothetical protein